MSALDNQHQLSALGWRFREDGLLCSVSKGEPYTIDSFNATGGDYEELASTITRTVVSLLGTERYGCMQRQTVAVPTQTSSENSDTAGADPYAQPGTQAQYFQTPDAHTGTGKSGNTKKLLILIPGIGARAGLWGRSLCATGGLEQGSFAPFIRAGLQQGAQVVALDPNAGEDPFDGEASIRAAVLAWRKIMSGLVGLSSGQEEGVGQKPEIFIVAHSFGGACLIDALADTATHSPDALACIRGIAFTDSAHHTDPGCVQLSNDPKAELPEAAAKVLKKTAVLYLAEGDIEVGTEIDAFNETRGCRTVSAGTHDHTATNPMSFPCILKQFGWSTGAAE